MIPSLSMKILKLQKWVSGDPFSLSVNHNDYDEYCFPMTMNSNGCDEYCSPMTMNSNGGDDSL